jgi:hypothetical protein
MLLPHSSITYLAGQASICSAPTMTGMVSATMRSCFAIIAASGFREIIALI